ncbi:MAG: protein-disulfide reductase DsbD N-terminal domain-containing protein [Alphaproteobacteria bacterium]|nr:protein-disulfide reductase DsbD N-terminal domain-containing protein [Alphaproteobacteria bacterium]
MSTAVLCWMLVGGALANPYADRTEPVAVESQPFEWVVPDLAAREVELILRIPEGYAVYRENIRIEAAKGPVSLGEPVFPEPKLASDPGNPEEYRALYDGDIAVRVPVKGSGVLELTLEHQGCRKGLCWPITTSTHAVRVVSGG